MQFRFTLEVEDEVFTSLLSRGVGWVGGWVGGWCREVKNRANLSQVMLKLRLRLSLAIMDKIFILIAYYLGYLQFIVIRKSVNITLTMTW